MSDKPIPLVTWRGKCVDNGMLVTGRLEPCYDSADVFDGYYIHSSYFKYRVIPESLAVFTGLYDANGTPIYASVGEFKGGDVVKSNTEGGWGFEVVYEIINNRGRALWCKDYREDGYMLSIMDMGDFDLEEFQIIGNAYANPELLQVQS